MPVSPPVAQAALPAAVPVNHSHLVKKVIEKRRARVLKTRPQVRKTFPPESELRSLASSVIKRQVHPFIILRDDTILDGECRWRGLMLENPDFEVDVIVVDRELPPTEVCEMQLVSALHSTSLTSYDQALACKEWLDQNPNATAKELAEKIDRDASLVSKLLSLWRTAAPVIKAAQEEKIGVKAWYQISLLPEEADQIGLLELYFSGMPASQITEAARKKRTNGGSSSAAAVKTEKFKGQMPSGALVQVTGQDLSLQSLIELLGDLHKQARSGLSEGMDIKAFMALLAARSKDKAKKS